MSASLHTLDSSHLTLLEVGLTDAKILIEKLSTVTIHKLDFNKNEQSIT